MKSKFLPEISKKTLDNVIASGKEGELFDLLVQPLHEELYKRQTFEFLDDLSIGQQLMLTYDYVQMQVMQGGFIQLIQNGYVGLLLNLPGWLSNIGADDMGKVIDDALKVYVLNHEILDKKTTVEEFAELYNEMKEFEILDESFSKLNDQTTHLIIQYVIEHRDQFANEID